MGVQLICDECKRAVLSVIPMIVSQAPGQMGPQICIRCLKARLDKIPKSGDDE